MVDPTLARRVLSEYGASMLPEPLRTRFMGVTGSWTLREMLPIARAGRGDVRLLIAPANFASQAYYWARAAETLPGVSARNLMFGYSASGITVRPDLNISKEVGYYSRGWALRQRREIINNFTHVIYEAERSILPSLYNSDLLAEIRDLQSHGVKVAVLSHGSDIRTPSEHVATEPHSPFRDPLDGLTEALEKGTIDRRRILAELDVPQYVSTPDLLRYLPGAQWLPTLTDPQRWLGLPPPRLAEAPLRVLHIPSRSVLKGTSSIRAAMHRLQDRGLIEYVEVERVPYEEMPSWIGRSDVVIDQVSMGLYGVASVEAMLAGRPVIAQAGDFIRTEVKERTGWDLPIIEANPDTLEQVVESIAQEPSRYADTAVRGREYALAVHSAEHDAQVLYPFLFS